MRKRYKRKQLALHIILCIIAIVAVSTVSHTLDKNTDEEAATEGAVAISEVAEPKIIERYVSITMTDDELWDFAAIIYLEAANQSDKGQQAVAEVILNRVIANNFPDTIHDVLYQGAGTSMPQFSTISLLDTAKPTQDQYDAIIAALYGPSILPNDVVFFSRSGENSRVWGIIGDHIFCYQYIWE